MRAILYDGRPLTAKINVLDGLVLQIPDGSLNDLGEVLFPSISDAYIPCYAQHIDIAVMIEDKIIAKTRDIDLSSLWRVTVELYDQRHRPNGRVTISWSENPCFGVFSCLMLSHFVPNHGKSETIMIRMEM